MKKIAFKCLECGKITSFPESRQDGNRCPSCGGVINPIGEYVKGSRLNGITIEIGAIGLDEIEEKLKRIDLLIDGINSKAPEFLTKKFNIPPAQ